MIRIEALTSDFSKTELASVRIYADVADIANLPKLVRLNKHGQAYIEFRSNDVNGGTNETGVKRLKALLKAADKHGIGIVFAQPAYFKDVLNAPLWGRGMANITRSELEGLLG